MDAVRVQPKGKRGKADEAVSLIGKLYGIEREYKDAKLEDRHAARQRVSVPILAELHAWMLQTLPLVTAYFSPSWTAFQADRGRDFSVIVDGISN